MKHTKKIAFLLSLAMLVPVFGASCKKSTSKENNSSVPTASTVESDEGRYDANGYLMDDLPEDLKFDDEEISILHWSEGACAEFDAENNGEIISDAVYARNVNVKDRLSVKLNFIPTEGNNRNMEKYVNMVMGDVMSSSSEYDIFGSYSMCAATMAMSGYLTDLMEDEDNYLDFEKPWWPQNLTKEATINNKLYFCSGDISTNILYYMFVIFFNKELVSQNKLESPYTLVENGEWTYGKLIELTKGFYDDLNRDTLRDASDKYGLVSNSTWCDAFFFASGLNTIDHDSDGKLVVSDTWGGSKTHDLLTDLCNFFTSGDGYLDSTTSSKAVREAFTSGRSVFLIDGAGQSKDLLASSKINYGVVPVPKYDAEQENYYTTVGFTYTMYSISTACDIKAAASATLECLASEAYRGTTPEMFEKAFKYRYAPADSESNIPMWNIIKDSISFDLGRIFSASMNKLTYSLFRNALSNNQAGSWYSTFTDNSATINECLDTITKAFK